MIYGGLGNDALHGGAGDDAMSGAEAPSLSYTNNYDVNGVKLNTANSGAPLESDLRAPVQPGQRPRLQPDDDLPGAVRSRAIRSARSRSRRTVRTTRRPTGGLNWLLNFSSTEGPADSVYATFAPYLNTPTDGNDALFGDLGNDWLVGGTGRDTMYGGWGNDYLNADDKLDLRQPERQLRHEHRHRHEPVVRGHRLRRRRPRRPGREHRRRPPDRLERRVRQLPDRVRAVRHGDGQPHRPAAAARVPVRALARATGPIPFLNQHYTTCDPTPELRAVRRARDRHSSTTPPGATRRASRAIRRPVTRRASSATCCGPRGTSRSTRPTPTRRRSARAGR